MKVKKEVEKVENVQAGTTVDELVKVRVGEAVAGLREEMRNLVSELEGRLRSRGVI